MDCFDESALPPLRSASDLACTTHVRPRSSASYMVMGASRIVHLVHERIGTVGGIQRFDNRVLLGLSRIALERGCELELIAMHDVRPDADLPSHIRVESARGSRSRLLWLLFKAHLRGIDQAYIGHLRLAKLIWPIRLLFRRARYVLFIHGVEAWDAGRTPFHRSISRWLVDHLVDDVVSVSHFTAQRMRAAFQLEQPRFHILPNALTFDAPLPTAPMASSGSDERPVVLTVARMDRHDMLKGIPAALQAIKLLRESYPTLRYRIVGDGELRAQHEKLAHRLGLSEHVEFLGRVPDTELHGLYKQSDVFLLPSAKEGFGIVFLEAWLHGLPIVCGNLDASSEVVEHGIDGFTVAPQDPMAIAQALRTLLSNPEMRRSFVERGREKVMLKYSAPQFLERLQAIVEWRVFPTQDEAQNAAGTH